MGFTKPRPIRRPAVRYPQRSSERAVVIHLYRSKRVSDALDRICWQRRIERQRQDLIAHAICDRTIGWVLRRQVLAAAGSGRGSE